ncbi:MAG: S41 family peptidase, partial [Bacteroidetes bacterium]|nr:S41 family peptidase [Bacteroidota bacterium]
MKNGKCSAVAACLAVAAFACFHLLGVQAGQQPQQSDQNRVIQNLRAFAKIYGYVKYFHPSDEASDTDWHKFAVLGVAAVKTAMDQEELETRLRELFLPIAPTMRLYRSGRKPTGPVLHSPEDPSGLKTVAWQHLGIELGRSRTYSSKRINRKSKSPAGDEDESEKLFDKVPAIGECIEAKVSLGLHCQIPLALYSDQESTLGSTGDYPFQALKKRLSQIVLDKLPADDEDVRFANLIIAWNVFQHFYPYFDVVKVNWESVLTKSLRETKESSGTKEFYDVMRRLVEKLQDGHGGVYFPDMMPSGRFPVQLDWVENQLVVVYAGDSKNLRRGDIIRSFDGILAERALKDIEQFISGSPQWKRSVSTVRRVGAGEIGTVIRLLIQRGDQEFEVEVERVDYADVQKSKDRLIEQIEEGIYYVNLTTATMDEIDSRMKSLAKAEGVIFDLRGYPRGGNHEVLQHLITEPVTSARWNKPQVIYPDQKNLVGYDTSGRWQLTPKEPTLRGTIIFLTNARAISYAESIMGIVEHYHLAEIVGQPTAGTNGNVNPFKLIGGYRINWTGMKVLKHDGSQHHLIGIRPTVGVRRTIKAVREG